MTFWELLLTLVLLSISLISGLLIGLGGTDATISHVVESEFAPGVIWQRDAFFSTPLLRLMEKNWCFLFFFGLIFHYLSQGDCHWN